MEQSIFSTDNEHEALQVKEFLEQNSIPCYIKNLYTQNLFTYTKFFTGTDPIAGQIQIIAKEQDVETALRYLTDYFGIDEQSGEKKNENNTIIKSKERTIISKALIFTVMSFLIIPIIFNIKNIIYLYKNNKIIFYLTLILNLMIIIPSILFYSLSRDNIELLVVLNMLVFPLMCLRKGVISYKRTAKKIDLLWFLPITLLALLGIYLIISFG